MKNRIALSAMTTGFGFDQGVPTKEVLAYYAERSQGAGLATVGFSAVRPEGRVEDQVAWLWPNGTAQALAALSKAIHGGGAKAGIQLGHGGRQVSPRVIGELPVAPSAIAAGAHVAEAPRALSIPEVQAVIDSFTTGAVRAADAGFDAIELHAGHGYLLWQFLSADSNRRTDRYGGDTVAQRSRFAIEVVSAVRAAVPDLALLVRINGSDLTPDSIGGSEGAEVAVLLEEAGADGLVVSAGVYGTVPWTIPLLDDPEACFASLAAEVRSHVGVPVIAVGRITTPEVAEDLLARESCDGVALGRALLADPEWVAKAQAGRSGDIRPCIATVQGCAGMLQHGDPISCSVNPDVGREVHVGTPPRVEGRVLVVGGGPAGMEAARIAALGGATVTLAERSDELGGALAVAACSPTLAHMQRLIDWYIRQLAQLDVEVLTRTEADANLADGYDHVVVATGAEVELPVIDGYDRLAAWTADDLLKGRPSTRGTLLADQQATGRLAVVGRGQRAVAVATWCLSQKIEPVMVADGRLGHDTAGVTRRAYLIRLAGTKIRQGHLERLDDDGVIWADSQGEHHDPVDGVVLVEPLRPSVPAGLHGHRIGDAKAPRSLIDAVAEARDLWGRLSGGGGG